MFTSYFRYKINSNRVWFDYNLKKNYLSSNKLKKLDSKLNVNKKDIVEGKI